MPARPSARFGELPTPGRVQRCFEDLKSARADVGPEVFDAYALVGTLDHLARCCARVTQFHCREVTKRLAVIAAASVIPVLPRTAFLPKPSQD